MNSRESSKTLILISIVLLGVLLASCKPQTIQTVPETGTYLVDAMFREFYATLGGSDVLGPAITAMFSFRDEQCQYTQNALMCFNAQAQGIDRYNLYPLGDSIGIAGQENPAATTETDSESIAVYGEFDPLYNKMYGPLYVGQPLTQARYNPNRGRIEQYFENVGFYRDIDSPRGEIHLLSYGVYACSSDCRFPVSENSVVVPSPTVMQQPFLAQVVRLGGQNVFGMPLTEPYQAADGNLEQVYENAVFYAPPDDLTNVHLRNTPLLSRYASHRVSMPASLLWPSN